LYQPVSIFASSDHASGAGKKNLLFRARDIVEFVLLLENDCGPKMYLAGVPMFKMKNVLACSCSIALIGCLALSSNGQTVNPKNTTTGGGTVTPKTGGVGTGGTATPKSGGTTGGTVTPHAGPSGTGGGAIIGGSGGGIPKPANTNTTTTPKSSSTFRTAPATHPAATTPHPGTFGTGPIFIPEPVPVFMPGGFGGGFGGNNMQLNAMQNNMFSQMMAANQIRPDPFFPNISDPFSNPFGMMNSFSNPMMNPFGNPMMNPWGAMNPMMANPMMMNPMMANPMMNPWGAMNPMMANPMMMNPMMANPMMNPWGMMNPMGQSFSPGVFGPANFNPGFPQNLMAAQGRFF
jgi:hypothetical protein